jgi:hypothetical protein
MEKRPYSSSAVMLPFAIETSGFAGVQPVHAGADGKHENREHKKRVNLE